jgi:hypothetical protein
MAGPIRYGAGGGSEPAESYWEGLERRRPRACRPLGPLSRPPGRGSSGTQGVRQPRMPIERMSVSRTSAEIGTRYDRLVNQLPRSHLPRRNHELLVTSWTLIC